MKKYFIYILIFLIAFCVRLYGISHKIHTFCDETFTYICSTQANSSPDGEVNFKQWYKGDEIPYEKDYKISDVKKSLFGYNPEFSSVINDLKRVRSDNIDRQHANLYYSIIRIWNNGLDGTDFGKLTKHSAFLNLIFFTLSFFFMYKLLSLIKDDKRFIALGLFFAFISTGTVSNTLLVREYALSETLFILVTYLAVKIYKRVQDEIPYKTFILCAFPFSLYLLSSYYSVFYTSLIFIWLIIVSLFYKKFKIFFKIIIMAAFTCIYTIIIYPSYFNFSYNNERYQNILDGFFNFGDFAESMRNFYYCTDITDFLFYKSIIVIILVLGIYAYIKKIRTKAQSPFNPKEKHILLFIIGIAIIFTLLTVYTAPFRLIRYIYPAMPVLSLILTVITYKICNLSKICGIIIVVSYFICSVLPLFDRELKIPYTGRIINMHTNFDYGYISVYPKSELERLEELKQQDIIKNSDDVFLNFVLKDDIPVVFLAQENQYYMSSILISRLGNNANMRFEYNVPDFSSKYKEFYLIGNMASEEEVNKIYNNAVLIIRIYDQCIWYINNN